MKSLIASLLSFFVLSLGLAVPVVAQSSTQLEFCSNPDAAKTEYCINRNGRGTGTSTNNTIVGPDGILTRVVKILVMVVGIAAVISIIIGGFMLTLSSGDASQVTKGRNTIIYGSVGLLVAMLAQAIVMFILNKL